MFLWVIVGKVSSGSVSIVVAFLDLDLDLDLDIGTDTIFSALSDQGQGQFSSLPQQVL